jgi:hypothetical protein
MWANRESELRSQCLIQERKAEAAIAGAMIAKDESMRLEATVESLQVQLLEVKRKQTLDSPSQHDDVIMEKLKAATESRAEALASAIATQRKLDDEITENTKLQCFITVIRPLLVSSCIFIG